jgi:hypothetical protein
VTDGQYETPDPDRAKPRVAPRVVLASAGVVVATLFATVAALTSGSDDAVPAARNPLEDVVSKSTLRSVPSQTGSTAPAQVDVLSSVGAPPTTTTTPQKVKITTVTQSGGATTTVGGTTPPRETTVPPATTVPSTSTSESASTVPVPTTTEPLPSSSASAAVSSSANDGTVDR